jgi:hypothetical protein
VSTKAGELHATDSRSLDASAIDEGSGVRDLSLSLEHDGDTEVLRQVEAPCHPDHDQTEPTQDSSLCPREAHQSLNVDVGPLPNGPTTFSVDASDLADNTASAGGTAAAFSIYLDRKPPTVTASGELYTAADSWFRPQRPGLLTVTGADTAGGEGNTSGIADNQLTAVDAHGTTVLTRDADTCTPPGPITAPCDPGKASTFTVDPRQLPEGPVRFSASSTDLAGNASDPAEWTVRLDRTPPAARATGDLLALTSQHTNSTTPTSVTLQGRDAASGIARLQLIASNSDGEKLLADRDTCTSADLDPTDGACPHTPSVQVSVDPGDLPDGPTTFIARAIDQAGNKSVDNQDWDTYVDHTPPDPPDSVSVTQTSSSSVQITWPTVVDQPLGSGGVSYQYLVTVNGQPIGTWRPTNNPYANVGGLPPGVDIKVLVEAVDAAQNVGKPAEGQHTLRGVLPIEGEPGFSACVVPVAVIVQHGWSRVLDGVWEPGGRIATVATISCVYVAPNDVGAHVVWPVLRGSVCVQRRNSLGQWQGFGVCTRYNRPYPTVRSRVVGATRIFEATIAAPDIGNCTVLVQDDAHFRTLTHIYARQRVTASGAIVVAPHNVFQDDVAYGNEQQHCPTELESWDRLTRTSPDRPKVGLSSPPSALLRSVLGDTGSRDTRPVDTAGNRDGWEAHHIIPSGAAKAASARISGFRCHVHPNSTLNGIWLRGRLRADGTPGYDRLGPEAKQRLRHSVASRDDYYSRINALMATTRRGRYGCDQGQARQLLGAIYGQLAVGVADIHQP